MQDTMQTIYQPGEKSIFIELLDTEIFLERYEHALRGEVLTKVSTKDDKGRDIEKKEWVQKYNQKMTDYGITSVMSFLRTICDKTISMTDLDETLIDTLIIQNANAWLDFLLANYLDFGLAGTSKIIEVYYPGRNLIVAKFRSAVDGMTVNAISKTTNVSEVKNMTAPDMEDQNQGKLGFLSKLGIKV